MMGRMSLQSRVEQDGRSVVSVSVELRLTRLSYTGECPSSVPFCVVARKRVDNSDRRVCVRIRDGRDQRRNHQRGFISVGLS